MKPSILFILHMPPPVHGASMMGSYIKESAKINEAFDTEFLNLSSSNALGEIGKYGIKKKYQLVKILLKVVRALFRKKYDLVYLTLTASGPGFYKDALVVSIVKLFGKKIIYHFHNKGLCNAKETFLNRILYKFVFKNTKSILISEALYKDFERYLNREDTYFCFNGIPAIDESTRDNSSSNLEAEITSFLFLSNMMKEKGVYDLLDACEILKNKRFKFKCDFVGSWSDISEHDFLNAVKSRHLEKIVLGHGKKYGKEKNIFFTSAHVFVFPTYYHYESFPLVILEAMGFGLPVISTMEGGIPDEIADGETGFLVPRRDINSLAAKMELFINKPALRIKMGIAGKERFNDYFTLEKFEDNLVEIFKIAL